MSINRDKLEAFYHKFCPEKVDRIDVMLQKFDGEQIVNALRKKYGDIEELEGVLMEQQQEETIDFDPFAEETFVEEPEEKISFDPFAPEEEPAQNSPAKQTEGFSLIQHDDPEPGPEAATSATAAPADDVDDTKQKTMIIFIKTPDRQTITFGHLERTSTIRDIKLMIFMLWRKTAHIGDRESWPSRQAIPPDEQVLLWRGLDELDDSLTINDYYISDRSTLHVMPRSYYQNREGANQYNNGGNQEYNQEYVDEDGDEGAGVSVRIHFCFVAV